jgi:hypothetical protein
MCSRTFGIGILVLGSFVAAGCGGGATFANKPRPPTPVNLSVYVNNARVSISPTSVGAGPVVFLVSNAADRTESVTIQREGGGPTLGTTGPINPQSTAQVTVDFRTPGDYTVATVKVARTEAARFTKSPIQPAKLHIGRKRASASNQLLQP